MFGAGDGVLVRDTRVDVVSRIGERDQEGLFQEVSGDKQTVSEARFCVRALQDGLFWTLFLSAVQSVCQFTERNVLQSRIRAADVAPHV